MKKLTLLTIGIILLLAGQVWATDYTFDNNGGAGDNKWSTTTNWDPEGTPGTTDNVIIAANCDIDAAANCANFTLNTGITVSGAGSLSVYGNFVTASGSTWSNSATLVFRTGTGKTITTNNVSFTSVNTITVKNGGTFTLVDNFAFSTKQLYLYHTGSSLSLNGNTLSCSMVGDGSTPGTATLDFGTGGTLNAGYFSCASGIINATGTGTANFTPGNNSRSFNFNGANWAGSGITTNIITGTYNTTQTIVGANTFGALVLTKTSGTPTVKFPQGATTTLSSFDADGFTITSSDGAHAATLSDSAGTNTVYNCTLSWLAATGGAVWHAYTTDGNTDGGNTSGWLYNPSSAPTLTQSAATSVTSTGGVGHGNVSSNGGSTITAEGVCVSTSNDPPTTADTVFGADTIVQSGDFTATMSGLTPNQTYHYRAFATNAVGTNYGDSVSIDFNTPKGAPSVTCQNATDKTQTTATGNGTVTNTNGEDADEVGVCWSTTSTNPTKADNYATGTPPTGTGSFTANITGLSASTTYHYAAYAHNSYGYTYTTGNDFTTLRNPGTFYMRSDGTAANLAAATGPSSTQANCMNVTVHNAATLIPGDTIYMSDKGGDYTPNQLTWSPDGIDGLIIAPNSGTAINPIIYANVPGETPTINMTWIKDHDGTIWTDLGGGIYETNANLVYYARVMWEDGVVLQKATTAELTNGREYYASGRLYYKPTSGTPADHTLKAIWFTDTNWSPYAFDMRERSYIDVSGLTFNYGTIGVAQNLGTPGTSNLIGIKVHGCTFNYAPWAIWGQVKNNIVFQDADFYNNTLNYCNGGISIWTNSVTTAHTQKPLRVKIYNNTINHHFSIDETNNWKYAWGSSSPDHEAISFQDAVSCEVKNNIITHDLPLTTVVRAIFLYNNGNSDSVDDNIIAFNKISGGYDRAINFSGYTTSAQGNIIACNSIYCPLTSITISPKQNNQIYVNILSNPATGINYIYNNSIFTAVTDTGSGSVGIYLVTNSGKWTVGNNIISMAGGACIIGDATNKTDYVISYNNYYGGTFYADEVPVNWATWQGLGWDVAGSFENQDPLFVGTGADPLKLQANSPCINAGTTPPAGLLPLLSVDIDGNPRPR